MGFLALWPPRLENLCSGISRFSPFQSTCLNFLEHSRSETTRNPFFSLLQTCLNNNQWKETIPIGAFLNAHTSSVAFSTLRITQLKTLKSAFKGINDLDLIIVSKQNRKCRTSYCTESVAFIIHKGTLFF